MLVNYKNKLKQHFLSVVRTKKSPHSIALGFAIGTLIGILPTPGISVFLGLLVILIFKKINKFSLFLALLLWNPIILTPIYLLSFEIGNLLFGNVPVVEYNIPILNKIYNNTRRYLVGNAIIAMIASVSSYFVIKSAINFYRGRKKT